MKINYLQTNAPKQSFSANLRRLKFVNVPKELISAQEIKEVKDMVSNLDSGNDNVDIFVSHIKNGAMNELGKIHEEPDYLRVMLRKSNMPVFSMGAYCYQKNKPLPTTDSNYFRPAALIKAMLNMVNKGNTAIDAYM